MTVKPVHSPPHPQRALAQLGDLSALLMRLRAYSDLQQEEIARLSETLPASEFYPADTLLVAEGDPAENVHLVVSGLACRCKEIDRGRRQITGYLLPGDFCNLHVFIFREMDHSIRTLTETRVVKLNREQVEKIISIPSLSRALLFSSLVEASVSREWVTNMGRRTALERLAHHFCEIYYRMRSIGLNDGDCYNLPINQAELADAVGLSLVHTNKSLRILYKSGLVHFSSGRVEIIDIDGLRRICSYSSAYLNLDELRQ